ncbi:MAG: permease-like cell division protein FtsX [Clostridia bacterium]|nr:permease-like cell division protein FtsX [Clostridia bacterium]
MRYNSFSYLISEGFKNIIKNGKASVSSLVTMICAMILFGVFFSIGENIESAMSQIQMSQGVEVFILDEATDEQVKELGEKILNVDGVNTVTFKSKQEALDSMKEDLKEYQELLGAYDGEKNIFPASYIVKLTNLEKIDSVQDAIKGMEFVDTIKSSDETIDALIKIANALRIGIGVIFVLLLVISITIISNTIKLSVHNRRKEISIMKYVGATNSFIRGPFVVEGIMIGIMAGVITLGIIAILYGLIISKIETSSILQSMQVRLLKFEDIYLYLIAVNAFLGVGIGVLGSSISMKKYLEV